MKQNIRQYARQTRFRLVVGFLVLLFLIGDGLIYLVYGRGAALLGLICMVGGLLPVVSILLFFWLGEQILKRNR